MTALVIPKQWLTVPLDDVILRVVGGGTPSKSKPEYYQGEIPWMSVKDMNKHVLHDTTDHISQAAVDNSSTNVIPAGTPIIATRMSLGKIVIADFESAINQDLKALFLPTKIHRDYLVYWYRSVARQIEQMGTGTTVKGIRLEALKGLEFALPPLAEQKVIADKLDTLLAQVGNTKARLERIPQILKRFRQSVLAAAVSGRLTEEWRNNSTYNDEGYPDSWSFKHLCEVGQLARGKSKHRPRNDPRLFGEEYPFIQTGEVANATGEITSATRFYSAFGLEQSRLFPAGTLCITIAANIADTAVLGIDACFPDSVVGFTPKDSEALAYFVKYLIDVNKQDLESFAPATAQKNINLKVLNELRLPFPTVEEQTEIVRRVDQLFAHADRIEQQVNSALVRVNNLTQSILAKAFRGELTEQWRKNNPELISGENSAEALLERIKTERAAAKPAKKTHKQTTA
ncbi:restriction endonuclease subunit S [Vreelandella neptunia]|uniref:Restriction endonuclease subunit S n=1 Tax=Vreelandella neptunia TaxID=115551 RepID=A0ABS9SCS0_9GAMM|nr:restriction endonuclease subunit S [Halomonas neptunia]MCH4813913.1 restriction endonuclease subunit S [Halomonas neptunia]